MRVGRYDLLEAGGESGGCRPQKQDIDRRFVETRLQVGVVRGWRHDPSRARRDLVDKAEITAQVSKRLVGRLFVLFDLQILRQELLCETIGRGGRLLRNGQVA